MAESPAKYKDTWYEAAMESRENEFARQFGPTSPPDQVIKSGDETWEMTIPGFAFLCYPPTEQRKNWLYLTHGLSQPAEFADFQEGFDGGASGFGIEFGLATLHEETWTFHLLESLARYILNSDRPILPGHRIPSGDLMQEPGGHLLAVFNAGYEPKFHTLSGVVHIIHFVGITADEAKHAKEYPGTTGSQILENVLRHYSIGCITDRSRPSVTQQKDFAKTWKSFEN